MKVHIQILTSDSILALFEVIFSGIIRVLQREFVIDGHTFSLWGVMLFVIVGGILAFVIGEFLDIGD